MADTVADRINLAMERRGLTAGMLSIKTGITERMIRNYRSGAFEPGGYSLRMLSKGLGVSTDWILGIDEEEPWSE